LQLVGLLISTYLSLQLRDALPLVFPDVSKDHSTFVKAKQSKSFLLERSNQRMKALWYSETSGPPRQNTCYIPGDLNLQRHSC